MPLWRSYNSSISEDNLPMRWPVIVNKIPVFEVLIKSLL